AARNPTTFEFVYGDGFNLAPEGFGPRNLSNGGEPVMLLGPLGEVIQSFTYGSTSPWPSGADGGGSSLEIIDPHGDSASAFNWRASLYSGGSPGASGIPGDYDGNNLVEQADYALWKSSYGLSVARGTGADGNRNGQVDTADFVIWRRGSATTSVASGASAARAAAPQQPQAIVVSATTMPSASAAQLDAAFATFVDQPSPTRQSGQARRNATQSATATNSKPQEQLLMSLVTPDSVPKQPGAEDVAIHGRKQKPNTHDRVIEELFTRAAVDPLALLASV
ncbi:MAG TPA: hypothetical protein VGK58_18165, partial [Lacipirellulaceae bacterium]